MNLSSARRQLKPLLAGVLRWIGRLTTIVIVAFVLLAATVPAASPSVREVVALFFFPGMVVLGLLLAWWREVIGAGVATVGLLGFYGWSLVSGAHFARGPWFIVCWAPAVFFVGSWFLRRQPRSSPAASALGSQAPQLRRISLGRTYVAHSDGGSMQGLFRRAAGYQGDALNLPVKDVDEAVPFYEQRLGFHLVEHRATPIKTAILERDGVRIGLAENGGDPTQDGSFFEVSSIDAAFEDLKSRGLEPSAPKLQRSEHGAYRAFFVVAPDGLCYMLGEPVP